MSNSQQVEGEAASRRAQEMLIEFLRDHDAACPVCGYNVRALTRPTCPECRQDLMLTVGAAGVHGGGGRVRLGWLLAAVAPGFFSGIAASFLLTIIIIAYVLDELAPARIIALDAFGLCSGAFTIVLISQRIRFIAQPVAAQRLWTLTIWLVHIAALLTFLYAAFYF